VLYLVTGGAGFIGTHLVEHLVELGHKVIVVDDLSEGRQDLIPICDRVTFVRSKFQDTATSVFEGVQGVFHLAAQSSVPLSIVQPYESSDNNLLSSLKALEVARLNGAPLVYASSSAVYGGLSVGDDRSDAVEVETPYALDKWVMEQYAKVANSLFGTRSLGLRFFNVYGPRQDATSPYSGVIALFIRNLLDGNAITLNGGHQTRDFIFVKDVVSIMVRGMHSLKDESCNIVNVGSGCSVSISGLLQQISQLIGVEPKVEMKDLPVGDPIASAGDYTKLRTILSVHTGELVKLEDGLRQTIDYFRGRV
jgi:UDP-glucose 4-epimerase